jgi:hypothetical protein
VINPNNPTGAVYPRALLEKLVDIARRHHLLLMADEIYDQITYDGAVFEPMAAIAHDVPCLSSAGLSKVHRACGWRTGWALLSGEATRLGDYHHAIDLLGALRLCANVPGQLPFRPRSRRPGHDHPAVRVGGRLYESRRAVGRGLRGQRAPVAGAAAGRAVRLPVRGRRCRAEFRRPPVRARAARNEGVLVVPGSSFNVAYRNHFRVTLLPEAGTISEVFRRIDALLGRYAQAAQRQRRPWRDRRGAGARLPRTWRSAIPTASARACRARALADAAGRGDARARRRDRDPHTSRAPAGPPTSCRRRSTPSRPAQLRPPYGWCRCRSASTTSTAAARCRSSSRSSRACSSARSLRRRRAEHVLVLSIPDWGRTPFARAQGRDARR